MKPVEVIFPYTNPERVCTSYIALKIRESKLDFASVYKPIQYVDFDSNTDVALETIRSCYENTNKAIELYREYEPVGILNIAGYPCMDNQALYVYLLYFYKDPVEARRVLFEQYGMNPEEHFNLLFNRFILPFLEKPFCVE